MEMFLHFCSISDHFIDNKLAGITQLSFKLKSYSNLFNIKNN